VFTYILINEVLLLLFRGRQEINPRINLHSDSDPYIITDNNSAGLFNN
jgi:hypothetical protein